MLQISRNRGILSHVINYFQLVREDEDMARKATTKKAETTAKGAEVVAKETAVEEVKPVEKEAVVEKPAAIRTAAAKTTTEKKAPAKKAAVDTEVFVQFWGKEVVVKDVVENIKKVWTEEMGKKEADMKDLKVYIKPEDNGAHYVINGEITGFVGL